MFTRRLSLLATVLPAAFLTLASFGCRAQVPAPGSELPPALARKLEVLLRQKANIPPASTIHVGPVSASELPGYSKVSVTFVNGGNASRPIEFLVSADGKTVAQFNKYDISADPRNLVSAEGRPSRGGPASAPVLIVGFDDLECPYCARLHESIFPAIVNRYGDKVHIVYKDFPLDQHPWAMRSAVDVNCLAQQSPAGYWSEVDYIHAHMNDFLNQNQPNATKEQIIKDAENKLDNVTREQAKAQKVDLAKLDACIAKQDTTAIVASRKLGESLNVDSTPALFINGAKVDGAVPVEFIFGVIDDALKAENVTPPPPYVAPKPAEPAVPAKPGN